MSSGGKQMGSYDNLDYLNTISVQYKSWNNNSKPQEWNGEQSGKHGFHGIVCARKRNPDFQQGQASDAYNINYAEEFKGGLGSRAGGVEGAL